MTKLTKILLSKGLELVRKDIADFINRRDGGIEANPDDIFVATGSTNGIKLVMELLLNSPGKKSTGFMVPVPQHSLYAAAISEFNAEKVIY